MSSCSWSNNLLKDLDELTIDSKSRYEEVRAQAKAANGRMIKAFKQGREAQSRSEKTAARNCALEHQLTREVLNQKASEWIFRGTHHLMLSLYRISF